MTNSNRRYTPARLLWCAGFVCLLSAAFAPSASSDEWQPWAKPIWAVHRCGEIDVPENTMDALRRSARLGAKYVELDLRATKDGQIVLLHDETIDRTTNGTGKLSDFTWEQIKAFDAGSWIDPRFSDARIPLFSEILQYAKKHDIYLILDIKSPDAAGADLYDLIVQCDMLNHCRIYMRAAAGQSPIKEQLDPRIPQFTGSLAQPWGADAPATKMQTALDNEKSMGALVRSYRWVLDFQSALNVNSTY